MNRKAQVILAGVTYTLLLAGAGRLAHRRPAKAHGEMPLWREVKDMTGRKALLAARPARILSLCTSATDTILALGAGDCLAAIDEFSRVVPGAERAVVAGKGGGLSREKVAALDVDLAFVWWYQDDMAEMLAGLAIPVARIRSGRAAEVPAMIRLIGECLDCPDAAERCAAEIQDFLGRASAGRVGDRPSVFLELYGPLRSVGGDTYTNDLLELAGGRNVAAEAKGAVSFSAERLVAADPDVILCLGEAAEALARRPGMAGLRAVRQHRVLAIERYWLVAGPHMPQSVEKLRAVLAGPPKP